MSITAYGEVVNSTEMDGITRLIGITSDQERRIESLERGDVSIVYIDPSTGTLNVAANVITANSIVANTITAAQIAANTITAGQIAANTIVAGNIAAGTITATQIAAGTITATQI